MMGSGNGRDDKGLYAALTGIIKYQLTSSFLIPTGDDAEVDEGSKPTFIQKDRPEQPQPQAQPPVIPAPTEQPASAPTPKAKAKAPAKAVKPAPEAATPPAQPPAPMAPSQEDIKKATDALNGPKKRADFGLPLAGDQKISQMDVANIVKAFSKFDISKAELEAKAGCKIEEFTVSMKGNMNLDYQALKQGRCTKDQFLKSELVSADYPAK
jgi:hypothetical protein